MASGDSQIDKPQRGHPRRAELPDVNLNTGAQSINTERACLRTVAGIDSAQLFWKRNTCHFHHTWTVFVQHSIANILKCKIFSRSTKSSEKRRYHGIYNVPTQEVGGCFDALHR